MFSQSPGTLLLGLALVLGLAAYAAFGGYFAREIVIEIAILIILAISLDFVAGYGGMVSLCHGAIYGLGAYLYAAATVLFALPPLAATGLAMVGCAAFGLAVGAVTARTTGIFFIMATLAFGQMLYALVFESSYLGGDDGMPGVKRLDFSPLGIDLNDSLMFAGLCLVGAVVSYALIATVLRAAFGRALCGIHSNEDRMRSLGASTWKYKAVAFAVSATVAGFAGTLAAQHTLFVSPELLVWTVSGEALVVVILGGIGTLIGPVIGAIFLVLLKHGIGSYTDHWHGFIGLILIFTVMAGGRGIWGQLQRLSSRRNPAQSRHAGD